MKTPVLQSIAFVSSGTMASLTDFRRYSQIDVIKAAWLHYEEATPTPGAEYWQHSWKSFEKSDAYQQARQEAANV